MLDWGIGHATRSVPIISSLSKNNSVILGTTPLNLQFFEHNFPELQKIILPSYSISYSRTLPVWLKILLQAPNINSVINAEHASLQKIISDHKIDVVISDNRFGLYSPKAYCVFITHQLKIKTPVLSALANFINQKFIHRFNEVWVPDYAKQNERLSGDLSDSSAIKIPVKYIGPQSYLTGVDLKTSPEKIDYLILLSGVEPQRSILEKLLVQQFENSKHKIVLVRGTEIQANIEFKNMRVHDFVSGAALKNLIVNAETVICRSGYSTLNDLHFLNKKKLVLIPTPGQSEQEYLAGYWQQYFSATIVKQAQLSVSPIECDFL